MIRFVAVIDLGKTNSKVALVDTQQCVEVQVIKQAAAVNSESLYPSLDHQAIEAFLVDALQALSAAHTIDAITVTTHGATAALLNESGQLAMPVMDYEFTEIDQLRDEYDQHRPSFANTGSPSLPGGLNIGAQLYWQQKYHARQFEQCSTVLTWPQYWVHRLTGQRHNDVTSLGCHTDLYEPQQQQYSTLVVEQQWHTLMPPTRHSGKLSGSLTDTFANKLSLRSTTPVYTGIHDSNASLVPHLIAQTAPFSVVSTGTWFITMAIGGTSTPLDESRDTLINVNARGESVPSARFMGGRERERLQVTEPATDQAMNELLDGADTAAMLMPSVVKDTGPYPHASHQWYGSEISHNSSTHPPPHSSFHSSIHTCAVTLYLALMTHECLALIGADGPTYIEGPLAQDKHYAQMLAAVSNRPVLISESETGTSIGAAMLINPPKNAPDYTRIDLDAIQRDKLEKYAIKWKQRLARHVK